MSEILLPRYKINKSTNQFVIETTNLAPYHVRKQLVESLVLSKLDYGCVVFYPLPDYQMKRLQRVQTTCASYVFGRCAVLEDLQKLNWLPFIERRDLAMLKIAHKALYEETWPEYLRLKFQLSAPII